MEATAHVFQWASVTADDRAGVYDATVYIDWDITWTATNGESGVLPATSRGTTFPLRVSSARRSCVRAPLTSALT